jgi:serpin B
MHKFAPASSSIRTAALLLAILVAACQAASPQSSTPASSGPSAVPSPASASPASSQAVAPSAAPEGLAPGALAITVSDRVRVRSLPRVADESKKHTPLLPLGTELLVLEGPVIDSGYTWYRVSPTSLTLDGGVADGWVAVGDHDGTPWVALAEAPLAGVEFTRSVAQRPTGTPAEAKAGARSINAFAFDLYQRLRVDSDLESNSIVYSPASILFALAMARAGARGTTGQELDAVLHSTGWEELGPSVNALDQQLSSYSRTWKDQEGSQRKLALRIANKAFAQKAWPIEQSYLDAINAAFGADVGLVDYMADAEGARRGINGWVSRQTERRIPELLKPPDVLPGMRLILVNAIYLKAAWEIPFRTDETQPRPFIRQDGSRTDVPTMTLRGGQTVPLARGDGWRATELRYRGANETTPLSMVLILPDDLGVFERGLTNKVVGDISTALSTQRKRLQQVTRQGPEDCGTYPYSVVLSMPKFSIDTRASLLPPLAALGLRQAASADADFTGMSSERPLYIGKVIHQANIDVDEHGTEAAAATAVGMDTGGCTGPQPARETVLRLDRPFLFALRDTNTGAILFLGRVLEPSAKS